MRGECTNCKSHIERSLFAAELSCRACGATLRVDNSAPRKFIYGVEAALIALGYFSSSTGAYIVLALLMIAALFIYLFWSVRSPLLVLHRKPTLVGDR